MSFKTHKTILIYHLLAVEDSFILYVTTSCDRFEHSNTCKREYHILTSFQNQESILCIRQTSYDCEVVSFWVENNLIPRPTGAMY
jgi:hypothetical protein